MHVSKGYRLEWFQAERIDPMLTIPATSTAPNGAAAFRRAAVDAADASTSAVSHRVSEADRALRLIASAEARISSADDAAIRSDLDHTAATETALDAAMVLRAAETECAEATADRALAFEMRSQMRDSARWSDDPAGGFDAADAVIEENDSWIARTVRAVQAARPAFDAAALALADAAATARFDAAEAEAATDYAEQVRSYARRVQSGLSQAACMADAAATMADAAGDAGTADTVAAEATHARNVWSEIDAAVVALSDSID